MTSESLLNDLKERTISNLENAREFNKLPIKRLLKRQNPTSWNVLECVEHLNRYGRFYLAEIEKVMETNTKEKTAPNFTPGFIGGQFAKSMLPGGRKMATFPDKNPLGADLTKRSIDEFIQQQEILMGLLERASNVNLNKVKTAISISKLFKIKLGDTFRVVVFHNQRHMEQAKKALKA